MFDIFPTGATDMYAYFMCVFFFVCTRTFYASVCVDPFVSISVFVRILTCFLYKFIIVYLSVYLCLCVYNHT